MYNTNTEIGESQGVKKVRSFGTLCGYEKSKIEKRKSDHWGQNGILKMVFKSHFFGFWGQWSLFSCTKV